MKDWGAPIIAAAGLTGTIALLNSVGGTIIMLLTIFVLSIRARSAWRNRNGRNPDDPTI